MNAASTSYERSRTGRRAWTTCHGSMPGARQHHMPGPRPTPPAPDQRDLSGTALGERHERGNHALKGRCGGLASLDFGAEPSRRAAGKPGRGPAGRHVLQAQRQCAASRPEAEHDGHLHHVRRGPRRHDASDPRLLTWHQGLAELADPCSDVFGRQGGELSRRPGAGQDFGDYLGELPGPRDGWVRPADGTIGAELRRRPGRLGVSRRSFGYRGTKIRVGARARHGHLVRRRARGPVYLAVVGRPVAGNLDEPQPAEGNRRNRLCHGLSSGQPSRRGSSRSSHRRSSHRRSSHHRSSHRGSSRPWGG